MKRASRVSNVSAVRLFLLTKEKVNERKILDIIDPLPFEEVSVVSFSELSSAIEANSQPFVLLISFPLADGKVIKLLKKVSAQKVSLRSSILCIVKKSEANYLQMLLSHGATDFCISPLSGDVLNARLSICRAAVQEKPEDEQAPGKDLLTELPNRQNFFEQVSSVYSSAKRDQISAMVVIIAPDHLSAINSEYGQAAGDYVLRKIATILRSRKRDTDLLCRYDGSKFCLMTVNMQETHLVTFLDDILASLQACQFQFEGRDFNITASLGATNYLGQNIDDMLVQAEKGLMQSRREGYNRFSIVNEMSSEAIPVRSFN